MPAQPSHGDALFSLGSGRCRVQIVALSVLSTSTDGSSSKKEGLASLVAAQRSITPRVHSYMVALHQWTSSADHSLDLACGRLSAHAKLGLRMVATACPVIPRRHFIELHLARLNMARPSKD